MPIGIWNTKFSLIVIHPLVPGVDVRVNRSFPLCSLYEDRKYNYINLVCRYCIYKILANYWLQ
jgi:hypothetical protein